MGNVEHGLKKIALDIDCRAARDWLLKREADELAALKVTEENYAKIVADKMNEIDRLKAENEKLKTEVSKLVLKFGGKNAGHAYGLTNCAACGELDNDYYLIGKS